jgi:hypothetical protein
MLPRLHDELRGLIAEGRQANEKSSDILDRLEAAFAGLFPGGDPEKQREAERVQLSPSKEMFQR